MTIYLDWNATAPLAPPARTAMLAALDEVGNASSVHAPGRRAHARLEAARASLAAAVGTAPRQLVFTSGGSEANALAFRLAGELPRLVSAIEHDSVLSHGRASLIPVDSQGLIDLDALDALLTGPAFVSVMVANNESGVIQPVDRIAAMVQARGGLLHCDAAQSLGKMDMTGCPADLITLSAHKMGGPQGVGALVIRQDRSPEPLIRGGGQEFGWRAGTQNIPAIAGFAAALDMSPWQVEAARLRDQLEARIAAIELRALLVASTTPRLCNTSLLWMPGVAAATQVMRFDLAGFAVSAGSACSSGKVKASHVLTAMGRGEAIAGQSIRISIGWETTQADIDAFVLCWGDTYMHLSRKKA